MVEVHGRPALERLAERLRLARRPEAMVVCTTTEPEDDELERFSRTLGLDVFRGSSDDILERWRGAATEHGVDLIVACDGDDLFCDPVYADRVVERHLETGADYVTCVGLPFGTAPIGIARRGLERVCELKTETSTEGQGRFFEDPSLVARAEVVAEEGLRCPGARMSLDYAEDLTFFEAVIAELERPGEVFSLREVVDLLRSRPDILAINAGLQERYWARFNERYPPVQLGA